MTCSSSLPAARFLYHASPSRPYALSHILYNLKLGKTHNGGIALSVIVQMVVLACSQGAVMGFLVMRRVRDAVRRVIVGFCALMPIFSVMAVSVTKDVPYTAAFVAVMLCACVIEERPESLRSKRLIVAYVVVVVFTCLLRNNGVVAVILMMIGGTVAMRMRSVAAPERRRFVAVSVVALCVAWAANMGLKWQRTLSQDRATRS